MAEAAGTSDPLTKELGSRSLRTAGERFSSQKVLLVNQSNAEVSFTELLNCRVESLGEDKLKCFGRSLKEKFKHYHLSTSQLVKSLIKNGQVSEAEELREGRIMLKSELEEQLIAVNRRLSDSEQLSEVASLFSCISTAGPRREHPNLNEADTSHDLWHIPVEKSSNRTEEYVESIILSQVDTPSPPPQQSIELATMATSPFSLPYMSPSQPSLSPTVPLPFPCPSVARTAVHSSVRTTATPRSNLFSSDRSNPLSGPVNNSGYNPYSQPSRAVHFNEVPVSSPSVSDHFSQSSSYLPLRSTLAHSPQERGSGLPHTEHPHWSSFRQRDEHPRRSFSSQQCEPIVGSYAPPPRDHGWLKCRIQTDGDLNGPGIDPASFHLIKQGLLTKPDKPYDGEGCMFNTFVHQMNGKLKGLSFDPYDIICILEAHTAGKPQQMIQNFKENGCQDPADALRRIQEALKEKYGSGVRVANILTAKIDAFQPIRSVHHTDRMEELVELCRTIEANIESVPELTFYNYANGIHQIWLKLPEPFRNAWRSVSEDHRAKHGSSPNLPALIKFLTRKVREYSSMPFEPSSSTTLSAYSKNRDVKTFKTEKMSVVESAAGRCAMHPNAGHALEECKAFEKLNQFDKTKVLREHKLCFSCTGTHLRVHCNSSPSCAKCGKDHITLLHRDTRSPKAEDVRRASRSRDDVRVVNSESQHSYCTRVCGDKSLSLSCSKTVLVDVTLPGRSAKSLRCYAILDDQSSASFADPKVAEFFGIIEPTLDYNLTTLTGSQTKMQGILVSGVRIKGVGERRGFHLPTLLTNNAIPENKDEVASPATVSAHKHVAYLAKHFNDIDRNAETLILLGRDCSEAMFSRCVSQKAPYAYRTHLGWALVGSVCTAGEDPMTFHKVLKTNFAHDHYAFSQCFSPKSNPENSLVVDIFSEHPDDELAGLSRDDRRFLDIVNSRIHVNKEGNITLPLPFKHDKPVLPNNYHCILNRSSNTLNRLKREPAKLQKCIDAMQKNIDNGHVEKVPGSEAFPSTKGSTWYIPVFPVFHDKKDKARLVFDSSAKYRDVSLNSLLLQGPDINNGLRTVLIRFRLGGVGFSADITNMFHNFWLEEGDKDKTRFFWYNDNDPDKAIAQYRARVHIFGNTSSPSLANIGLRFAVDRSPVHAPGDVRRFVHEHFYVDDGLMSTDNASDAVRILTQTKVILEQFNIHLHKIASNSPEVLKAFPPSELSQEIEHVNIEHADHKTLGLIWNVSSDSFVTKTDVPQRPFTKRGILATINSMFDPLGFVSPIVLAGKLIQRTLIPSKRNPNPAVSGLDWDDPLPSEYQETWERWKRSVTSAAGLSLPRCYHPSNFGPVTKRDIHVFSDASQDATGHAIYMRSSNGTAIHVSLVTASSKVAPRAAITIPRLELCAAVDAAMAAENVMLTLKMKREDVYLYTDSNIVLGYINNNNRRFVRYVARRISLITQYFPANRWSYVPTDENPADLASRPQDNDTLKKSCWFRGPPFLWKPEAVPFVPDIFQDDLPEVVTNCSALISKTNVQLTSCPITRLGARSSRWNKVVRVVQRIAVRFFSLLDNVRRQRGLDSALRPPVTRQSVITIIIKATQQAVFPDICRQLTSHEKYLPASHPLAGLSPFLGEDRLVRVGGRLRYSDIPLNQKFPVLLPSGHPVSELIVRHYHALSKHQGRVITQGSIREAGFFIQHGSKVVKRVLHECVTCRRQRGRVMEQIMGDLPEDRLEQIPPFHNTGMDIFGPYLVSEGAATRRSPAARKCWVVLFTCLVSRAVHLEPLPSMDASAFKNAFRRFVCLRGPCKKLRSDRGTNFIGARNQDLALSVPDLEEEFRDNNIEWELNPPKAPHFGGVWERKIGSVKNVLNHCISQLGMRTLTRDEFYTFLAEAAAIVNSTPLSPVSGDPNDPQPITPSLLLTMREANDAPNPQDFDERDILAYGSRRWRRVQHLAQLFWTRWRQDYLQTLQAKRKWTNPQRSLVPDDVVLLKDNNVKRPLWPLGRVTSVRLSTDGRVRSATVEMTSGGDDRRQVQRPISQLVLLVPKE